MAFTDTLTRWLEGIAAQKDQWTLRKIFLPLFDRESTTPINTAGLVIKGASQKVAKTGATDFYAIVNGVMLKIAASTDMPVLAGTVVNATFNVFCFFLDQAGVVTSAMGVAGSTLAKVVFPPFPQQKALIGFIIVNPTGTGNFVGNTTNLDDGTVVPNAVFLSPGGSFDPACLIGAL